MGRLSEYINGGNSYLDRQTVQIDSSKVDNMLNILDDDDIKRNVIYKSLIAGGKVLQGTAKQYFKQRMGESANHQSKYIKRPFADGIVLKGDKAYLEARVSIMKDFRMKFFEKGTEERYIKNKGHSDLKRGRHNQNTGKSNYRGRIEGKWFFKDARNASVSGVDEAMIRSIDNSLKRYGI